jgi:cyclopropane fatty-acyl-phospholipid synthase-like methyltransferase
MVINMNKPIAEACLRNQHPIVEKLVQLLPNAGLLLELGSGTGQHAVYCAQRLPHINWQPSDVQQNLAGIKSWVDDAALENLLPAIELDVDQPWPVHYADYVFTANTIHYISSDSVKNLFTGVSNILPEKGLFIAYGPVNENGEYTSEGNVRLDAWLKGSVNPLAGIKDLELLISLAALEQLTLVDNIAMPANNRLLVIQKN